MGYKSSSGIITIDSKKTSSELFWSLLEGHESECQGIELNSFLYITPFLLVAWLRFPPFVIYF